MLKRFIVLKCPITINMYILKSLFHVLNMQAIISYLCKIGTFQKEVAYSEVCIATNTLWLLLPSSKYECKILVWPKRSWAKTTSSFLMFWTTD